MWSADTVSKDVLWVRKSFLALFYSFFFFCFNNVTTGHFENCYSFFFSGYRSLIAYERSGYVRNKKKTLYETKNSEKKTKYSNITKFVIKFLMREIFFVVCNCFISYLFRFVSMIITESSSSFLCIAMECAHRKEKKKHSFYTSHH